MDCKSIGMTIAALRKKEHLSQVELAKALNVSSKTVSKWEKGLGYPEITQFPALSEFFGVTIDFLMTGNRKGIAVAGNILTDLVKDIESFPQIGMLANITAMSRAVGGCVPNTGIDLSRIDRSIPVSAFGRVGDDESGRYILQQLGKSGINVEGVSLSQTQPTGFSDVISLPTGERTFFHNRGANREFSPDMVNISGLNCKILHIGYLYLLDGFDAEDDEYGTVMARFLCNVRKHGIRTSIDMVSNDETKSRNKTVTVLPYCDYVIVNEIEACSTWGLPPYDGQGKLIVENIRCTMERMKECGVKEKVIVHCKEAGFCLDCLTGEFLAMPSLDVPVSEIKGSVGAGDAFCAGCLYGIYNKMSNRGILSFASAAAACSLFSATSVDGMRSAADIRKIESQFERKKAEGLSYDC